MKAIQATKAMKKAYNYKTNPATFSRGMVVGNTLYISGTASVGPNGETLHKGNFALQVRRMFSNVTEVLKEAKMNWHNIVKTTIYIRDIDRDYEEFNKVRREFFDSLFIHPYPASVCVEAKLCCNDWLIEVEAIAIIYS